MNRQVLSFFAVIVCLLACSCASSYRQIRPASLTFPNAEREAVFSYKYNVLKDSRNRKLMKKEDKRHVRIIAVKIVNTTGQTLLYGTNYKIYSMDREVRVLDPQTATAAIKQTVPTYLFYLLFTPMRLIVTTPNGTSVTPIGYVLGPALAGGNMAVAASSNKKFRRELEAESLLDRPILNGETFYGLIAIPDNDFMPLSLRIADR